MTSILPVSLSDLERDLDASMARLKNIDIPTKTLWNPWACPVDVLPYLAWAMSVDVWRSDWPEQIKRQVIAASPDVHRKKGTRPAVIMAINALGIDVELTEWWEMSPPGEPGTFAITTYVNDSLGGDLLGPENQALILETIKKNKRSTAHYEFTMGLGIEGPLQVGGAIEPMHSNMEIGLMPNYVIDINARGVFAGGLHHTLTLDLTIG